MHRVTSQVELIIVQHSLQAYTEQTPCPSHSLSQKPLFLLRLHLETRRLEGGASERV